MLSYKNVIYASNTKFFFYDVLLRFELVDRFCTERSAERVKSTLRFSKIFFYWELFFYKKCMKNLVTVGLQHLKLTSKCTRTDTFASAKYSRPSKSFVKKMVISNYTAALGKLPKTIWIKSSVAKFQISSSLKMRVVLLLINVKYLYPKNGIKSYNKRKYKAIHTLRTYK